MVVMEIKVGSSAIEGLSDYSSRGKGNVAGTIDLASEAWKRWAAWIVCGPRRSDDPVRGGW